MKTLRCTCGLAALAAAFGFGWFMSNPLQSQEKSDKPALTTTPKIKLNPS